ncbi:MAG TPA: hypothetical protein VHY81_10295 [Acidimicrobiales bacterium]|nr:hypothetical protein [Acidimicrobiales bacterium]
MERGVKVVGGVPYDGAADDTRQETDETPPAGPPPRPAARRPSGPSRRSFRLVSLVAALGLLGTIVFGVLYATNSSGPVQDPGVLSASRTFLIDFFNFTPKTVDSDFNAITGMATGQFSSQANQFFNSTIRKQLQTAAASSRGQIRYLAVQQEGNPAGTASIYAVVDQTYANNKSTSLGSDVVRLTADLQQLHGTWKISNVTVLEGATPQSSSSGGSGSGSSGSSVPGQ